MFWTLLTTITSAAAERAPGLHKRLAEFVLAHDRYWKGYFAGLDARERAHQEYLDLQKHFD